MKISYLKCCFIAVCLLCGSNLFAQPRWQWGKSGGSLGDDNAIGNVEDVVDIATDTKGNVYVLGKSYATANVDGHVGISSFDRLIIASWSCEGKFRWKKVFGSGSSCIGRSLRTDTLGGVYICGAMASYSAVGGPGYFDTDSTLAFNDKTMFIVKYDTAGTWKWLKMPQPDTVSVGNPSGAFDMDVAPNGDIYLYSQLTPGAYDNGAFSITTNSLYILKYNSTGVFQSVTPLSMAVSGAWSVGYGYYNAANAHFKRDHKNGRYYLCGKYDADFGTMSLGSTAITKPAYLGSFDNSGNCLWVKQSDGSIFNGGMISDRVATDEDENIYIGGVTYSGDGWNGYKFSNSTLSTFITSCPFVAKMDKNGNNIWVTNAESAGGHNYAGIALMNNTIACTGPYTKMDWGGFHLELPPVSPKYDNFVARINATTGSIIGMDSLKSDYGFEELASAIAADANGNFYIGGQFEYNLYVNTKTLTSIGGDVDWFVARHGQSTCNCTVPKVSFNTSPSSGGFSFTYTGSTPIDSVTWDFGDGKMAKGTTAAHSYTTAGTYTVCVTAYNSCGSNVFCNKVNATGTNIQDIAGLTAISIHPNPSSTNINIEDAAPGVRFELYNALGQRLLQSSLAGIHDIVDVSRFAPGIYLIQFTDIRGAQETLKFIKQ
jgi:hypothetical protein